MVITTFVRRNFLSLIIGALIGSVLAGGPLVDALLARWDEDNPAWVDSRSTVVSSEPGVLILDITARKVRACDHRRITSFARTQIDPYVQLSIERIDQPMTGMTRPLGVQHVGRYRLRSTPPRPFEVVVIAENECSGRLVLSKLAEVDLR